MALFVNELCSLATSMIFLVMFRMRPYLYNTTLQSKSDVVAATEISFWNETEHEASVITLVLRKLKLLNFSCLVNSGIIDLKSGPVCPQRKVTFQGVGSLPSVLNNMYHIYCFYS